MNIQEMHTLFRVIGQQKGLEQVRAILPNEIDVYLNAAINEKCRSVLIQNTSVQAQNKNAIIDSQTSPINALRTLYRTEEIAATGTVDLNRFPVKGNNDVFEYLSFFVVYNDGSNTTKQLRLIEYDKLQLVLNDYCNSPSKEYPIISLYSEASSGVIAIFAKLFVGINNPISKVVCNYIAKPAKVVYNNSLLSAVNCDLPDYLHEEIVQIAVNKFFQSVGSTTQPVK